MRKKILSLPLLIALGLASGHADAVGLGQIEVQSRLNQPLVAEIRLLQVAPDDLERMHVRLASPEAFARVGLDRPSAMTANLQFTLGTNARGEQVIRVTTPNRVNDPFLSFLLEIEWGAGRLVREYNVLLDPPYMAPATRAQVAPATTAPAAPVQQAPVVSAPREQPVAQVPSAAPEALPPASPPPAVSPPVPATTSAAPVATAAMSTPASASFTVVTGQTLSGIANRERDPDVSVNQMMIALLRANPEAFIDGNINLLRAGAVMRLPSRDEVVALRAAEANAMVSEQVAAWNARRAPVPQPAETPRQQPAPTPVASATEARLAIVPPAGEAGQAGAQSGAAAGGEGTQLRVELTQAEEEIAARDAEIEEMRSRMDELEALSQRQARMIELRSQEMEDMQRQLREAREGRAEAGAPSAEPAAAAVPWYRHPLSLGGLALLVIGGLVWLFTRRRREPAVTAGRAGSLAASIEAARTSSPKGAAVAGDVAGAEDRNVPDDDEAASDVTPVASTGPSSADVEGADGWNGEDIVADSRPPGWQGDDDVVPVAAVHDEGSHEDDEATGRPEGASVSGERRDPPADDLVLDDWGIDSGDESVSDGSPASADAPAFDSGEAEIDAVGTKLELARAYIDIGDLDGARSMLEEVRDEGSEAQQAQARELLDGLG